MQRLDCRGGLGGHESRGYRSLEAGSRGSEGAVGLARRFRGYRDPNMTFHAWAGVRQHSVARVSVVGTAPSTAAGDPRPVLSRIAWGRCDFRLVGHSAVPCRRAADVAGVVERVSWVWRLVREVGQGGGDGVDAEAASSESITGCSSEASWRGASGES